MLKIHKKNILQLSYVYWLGLYPFILLLAFEWVPIVLLAVVITVLLVFNRKYIKVLAIKTNLIMLVFWLLIIVIFG